jgi:hypothetical protein
MAVNVINIGSLISFNYKFFKHDPNPTVILTKILPDYLVGINIHYLTYNDIKRLLNPKEVNACKNKGFGYPLVKNKAYIIKGFRVYKRKGIQNLKYLDCDKMIQMMGLKKVVNPKEAREINKQVEKQINRKTNVKANQITENI